MNVCLTKFSLLAGVLGLVLSSPVLESQAVVADDAVAQPENAGDAPSEAAIERTRQKVKMLDNIFKQTIVLITDKYVHGDDDFAAGSAAVLLFKNISESGKDQVRLIDATGDPYEAENVARDAFEKKGVTALKSGKANHELVVQNEKGAYLRVLTPVPVVMEKCIMCHAHYADVPKGDPIGAISYTVPIQ
ncbi:c-type heme family protein [Rhodopirellula sp. P2]|uniref:c-type heme family protein n=1 Tax=Rhodopirellula sp. P2 TaxID=2127060 RepID=UPI002367F6F7|nr:DUF3365 domain-containing protein [Rhodopirellula sp. P2]WDQ15205.1 DUF3365 domain-containing protein [Rhodopirellula sp. P2]